MSVELHKRDRSMSIEKRNESLQHLIECLQQVRKLEKSLKKRKLPYRKKAHMSEEHLDLRTKIRKAEKLVNELKQNITYEYQRKDLDRRLAIYVFEE